MRDLVQPAHVTRELGYAAEGPVLVPARPSPPIARQLLVGAVTVGLFFGGFGAWAALAPLAAGATAPGTIKVESNRKTVQHLEGGIIRELLVRENDRVEKDQVLLRLDTTQSGASASQVQIERDTLRAMVARLTAERDGQARLVFPADLERRRAEPGIATILASQEEVFAKGRAAYQSQLGILDQRVAQLNSQIDGLKDQVTAADQQLRLIDEEIKDVQGLVKDGLERKSRLLALQRQQAGIRGAKGEAQAEIAKAREGIGETQLQIINVKDQYASKAAEALDDAQARLAAAEERLKAAMHVLGRTDIRAPMAGRVVNLRYFTAGGVIQPGGPILDLVPEEDRLVIEAQVSPLDIDVVHPGLEAEVRLTALKQRRTPTVAGKVTEVSADRFTDDKTGNVFYKAIVTLDAEELARLENAQLYPGMPTDVMIKLHDRTFVDYLITPITDSFHTAFREE